MAREVGGVVSRARRLIDLAAEGILGRDELQPKLAALEDERETARRELEALNGRREKIEELGRDKDALLEPYAAMVPESLDALTPEERHRVYKMLRLRASLRPDAPPEVSGVFGSLSGCEKETACSPWPTVSSWPCSRRANS